MSARIEGQSSAAANNNKNNKNAAPPHEKNRSLPALPTKTLATGSILSETTAATASKVGATTAAMRAQQQPPLPARVVCVRAPATNPTANPIERVQITPETSDEDLQITLLAIAGFPEHAIETAVVVLMTPDGRHITPVVAATLAANEPTAAYTIHVVKSPKTDPDVSIVDVTVEMQTIGNVSDRASEVQVIKDGMASLRRRLDRMDVDKLTFGKPFGMLSKSAKRTVSGNDRYGQELRYVFTDQTRRWLRSPTFDMWQWDDNELIALFELMFEELHLIEDFNISRTTLRKFLLTVRDSYNNNPFHNFKHAFCVAQMMYGIIHVTGLIERVKPIEKLGLVVACIGHDLDHPGYNNAYQINAKTELAVVYNDNAPLEMHHASYLFNILRRQDCNIFEGLSEPVFRDIRKLIIRCILSTDMARHGEILAQFKKVAEAFNYDDADHRAILLSMVVKCSDISNEVRPADVAEPWVNCLLEEFFSQSDREKAEGLPTAPFMDREKVTKPSAQVGFIGYVMIPLYEALGKVLPNMDTHVIEPIKASLAYYKNLLEKEAGANKK